MTKHYLKETAEGGVPTIPTIFWEPKVAGSSEEEGAETISNPERPSAAVLRAFESFGSDLLVVKPAVSAGSMFTYRVNREKLSTTRTSNAALLAAAAEEAPLPTGHKRTVRSVLQGGDAREQRRGF